MKKSLVVLFFLTILISIIALPFLIYGFRYVKSAFIKTWFYKTEIYTKSVTKKVDAHLVKKYSLNKNDVSLVSVEDMICENCTSKQFFNGCPEERKELLYCGKNFIYNINGKNTKVKYRQYMNSTLYSDNYIFDDYQKDQLSIDINNEFKSKIGDKVFLIKTSFQPLVYYNIITGKMLPVRNRTDDGFYVNYYDGDIENFITREYLNTIDIVIKIKPNEFDAISKDYLNKFETFSKNYCTQINEHYWGSGPTFDLYFLNDSTTSTEINELVNNSYENNDKRNILGVYSYLCGYPRVYSR